MVLSQCFCSQQRALVLLVLLCSRQGGKNLASVSNKAVTDFKRSDGALLLSPLSVEILGSVQWSKIGFIGHVRCVGLSEVRQNSNPSAGAATH